MIETVEIRTCDIAHEKPRKGADTIMFGLDSDNYLIELCAKDRATLERIMSEYIPHARRVRNGKPDKRGAGRYRSADDRRNSREIRAWAESNGIAVSDRGRIPMDVLARYKAAIGTG